MKPRNKRNYKEYARATVETDLSLKGACHGENGGVRGNDSIFIKKQSFRRVSFPMPRYGAPSGQKTTGEQFAPRISTRSDA